MACTPPVRTVTAARYQPVWSKGGATNQGISEVFVFTGRNIMEIVPMLKAVRATLTVENRTINAEVEVVFQATNDGITWEAPIVLSQAWVNADTTDTTPWYTTVGNFKRGIRFGVRIRQATGTAVEMARVSLVLDLELKS